MTFRPTLSSQECQQVIQRIQEFLEHLDPNVDEIMTGINSITSYLSSSKEDPVLLILYKQDVVCSNLFAHFPTLMALSNEKNILVVLSKDSQEILNGHLKKHAECSCILIRGSSEAFQSLYNQMIPIVGAIDMPWIRSAQHYIPANIKMLKTTAPILSKGQRKR